MSAMPAVRKLGAIKRSFANDCKRFGRSWQMHLAGSRPFRLEISIPNPK